MSVPGARRGVQGAALLVALLLPAAALAQQAADGRVEVGGGVRWAGRVAFAEVDANETSFGGVPRTVFKSNSDLEAAPNVEARFAVQLTSILQAESSMAFGRTHLTTRLTADDEAANATATESVTQYLIEGGVVVRLARWRGGRASPFASAGIGYLRQLHDRQTFVETGQSSYAGGGVHVLLKGPYARRLKGAGLRAEVRATVLKDGLTLDADTHLVPTFSAAMFVRF
jgi:opacity protein-like surface antigen